MTTATRPPISTNGRGPDSPAGPLARLGAWSYRRRRLVVVAWLAVLILFSFLGKAAGSQLKDSARGGHTESQRAADFLAANFPAQSGDAAEIVFQSAGGVGTPADRVRIGAVLAQVATVPHVSLVASPFGPGGAAQVSRDGRIAYAVVQFDKSGDGIPNADIRKLVSDAKAAAGGGLQVQLTGEPIEKIQNPSFGTAEGLGILAAMIILLLAFGSLIAMVLPIASALVAVATTFGVLDLLSHVMIVPSFGPELAALVGLGVGIDYALFVVTRYRNGLRAGDNPEQAVSIAMATSGRAVLFAGTTVVLSLLGLFLLDLPFNYGAALGAVTAVLLVMAASMTLLPAALGFAGPNIDKLHVGLHRGAAVPDPQTSFWARWSRQVQRRPWVTGGAALGVLVVLAVPFLSMRLAFTDAGTDPTSYTTRHAYDLLAQGFGQGAAGPLVVAMSLPQQGDTTVVNELAARAATLHDVVAVSPARYNPARTAAVVTIIPRTSPQDGATSTLVNQLRHHLIPQVTAGSGVVALVGGATAASIDTSHVISQHLPLVIAFVIILSVLLLVVAFRSIVIPVASALMTLLSTGAAYGVMVAVFQWGWLGKGIEFGKGAPVEPWIPVMLFALLFGLSMDYQVFLISRIRESWRSGQTDSQSVSNGLAATGRVITSAAAIMVCVFGAFVLGDLRILRLFGFAMAAAILLDATLVRMVLMPASLQLFGRANWWFPKRLDDVIPSIMPEAEPVSA